MVFVVHLTVGNYIVDLPLFSVSVFFREAKSSSSEEPNNK